MASSASAPQDAGGRPPSSSTEADSVSCKAYDRALLERVLRETLTDDGREMLDAADKAALAEVAARRQGEALSLDPVVVELVHAVLLTHFGEPSNSSELWRTISIQIGQSLWDDPAVRARLEVFWRRLCAMEP